jgi:hypothetical protein
VTDNAPLTVKLLLLLEDVDLSSPGSSVTPTLFSHVESLSINYPLDVLHAPILNDDIPRNFKRSHSLLCLPLKPGKYFFLAAI